VFIFGWAKSVWDLHRLTQRSSTPTDDALNAQLAEAQREIGVSGNSVAHRFRNDPPMTWGFLRRDPAAFGGPRLVAGSAAAGSGARARARKTQRRIGPASGSGRLCIYWFNPLVWYAIHRLHAERERACDDCVLRLGADGPDYADHLLQITRGLNSGFAQSAVSMAHPSQLKSRMIAILDSRIRRSRASRIAATSLLTIVSVLMLTIAAIQLTTLSILVLPAFASPLGVPCESSPQCDTGAGARCGSAATTAAAVDPLRVSETVLRELSQRR
jgi:hypothetical protein